MQFTTPVGFQAWEGGGELPSQAWVDQANDTITAALRGVLYDHDGTGRPTTAWSELERAANVQVRALRKAADRESSQQPSGPLASASIQGVSYTYAQPAQSADPLAVAGVDPCPWARTILLNAPGIYWGAVFPEG